MEVTRGRRRLLAARRRHAASGFVLVRAWPLEWVNGAPVPSALVEEEVEALRAEVAPEAFAGFSRSAFPQSSIPAFGLVAAGYAVSPDVGEALGLAVRDALFEQGLDVSDPRVLAALAARHDVVPLEATAAQAAVRADWQRGKARGVKGSPHFFVGAQDWFCPSLRIDKHDGNYRVSLEQESVDNFYASASV
jgi:predicted DsbA family dithiol-disulfide isomerase